MIRRAMLTAAVIAAVAVHAGPGRAAATPGGGGFAGTWINTHPAALLRTTTGAPPPLLPAAQAAYDKTLAAYRAGRLDFDPTQKCKAPGLARLLTGDMPFQIVQARDQVLFLWQWNHLASWARLNAQPDPGMFPTYEGNAVARIKGGALDIESGGFNQYTFLDAGGLPHSDRLHIAQRLTPSRDGRLMTDDLTITDPAMFARPWTARVVFRRLPLHSRLALDTCETRVKGLNGYY